MIRVHHAAGRAECVFETATSIHRFATSKLSSSENITRSLFSQFTARTSRFRLTSSGDCGQLHFLPRLHAADVNTRPVYYAHRLRVLIGPSGDVCHAFQLSLLLFLRSSWPDMIGVASSAVAMVVASMLIHKVIPVGAFIMCFVASIHSGTSQSHLVACSSQT